MQLKRKSHWDTVYGKIITAGASWFESVPVASLELLDSIGLPSNSRVIDIGGGDSLLVDHLLDRGFTRLSILDISQLALDNAKARLGNKGNLVKWIASDIVNFIPEEKYDCWHDRAAFHFLIDDEDVHKYRTIATNAIDTDRYLILGTFAENGPEKCSGLPVRRYSEEEMTELFSKDFDKVKCIKTVHQTPSGVMQNFIFCCFKKKRIHKTTKS